MKKLKTKDVKWFAQSYTVYNGKAEDAGLLDLWPQGLDTEKGILEFRGLLGLFFFFTH